MAASISPLVGYNNNVPHRGRIFHIQTEDSGVKRPVVVTHLFVDGGHIVKTSRTDYSDQVEADDRVEFVKALMKKQHKTMYVALRTGYLDELIEQSCGPHPEPFQPLSSPPRSLEPESLAALAQVAVPAPAPVPDAKALEAHADSDGDEEAPLSDRPTLIQARDSSPDPITIPAPPRERYPSSKPAEIFSVPPPRASLFGDRPAHEQSLDDVILAYLDHEVDS